MKISFVEIQNYRKLKSSRISFTNKETLFVGANNSGKTSAMDALIYFLDPKASGSERRLLSTMDFTLSNWKQINEFSDSWVSDGAEIGNSSLDWQPFCPSLDVWLDVNNDEVHRVCHLIPTLKWRGGLLGVRLIYQPKNIESLKTEFIAHFKSAKTLLEIDKEKSGGDKNSELTLWPRNLRDYLDKELSRHFKVEAYILDPSKAQDDTGEPMPPQSLLNEQEPLPAYPFKNLFKVNVIEAQRGFSDPNSNHNDKITTSISSQLNTYYERHLNPSDLPDEDDLDALKAIDEAKTSFDNKLNEAFKEALGEIKSLGYPGFNDPEIRLSSKVEPVNNLDHEAAVQFGIKRQLVDENIPLLALPEKYNGLGYKNLIAMVFRLISFRDYWMLVGKAGKHHSENAESIPPLQLVLIEEPEAHLHAQVQQVFIRKAYEVLRNHVDLKDNKRFTTQMIVSTHSSYLAYEVGFEKLRYFKRMPAINDSNVPTVNVLDLSNTFGEPGKRTTEVEQTTKFVTRYLKTTHCDLFFANAIIMVEGAAERILIPHFISSHYDSKNGLNSNYISILEVGGAHAHRFKPLIDKLGLPTLVITDTDAVNEDGKKTRPLRNKKYKTSSDTLKVWLGFKDNLLDDIIDFPPQNKIKSNIRAAYQCGIKVGKGNDEAIPYTFEDAIALTNIELFKNLEKPTGMLKNMKAATLKTSLDECCEELFKSLSKSKAGMALDLLFDIDPNDLIIPLYIKEGLDWLELELDVASNDIIGSINTADSDKND